MDLLTNGIHLQKIHHEICSFFMRIFKDDEIPNIPEFNLLNDLYRNEQKFKIISFLISASIEVFSYLPRKSIQLLIGDKIGLWRTLLVKLCLLNGADVHHLPLEVDIVASRNKLVIEALIFAWPFCSSILSDFLEYLCDSFHGSNNVMQPYIDDYAIKFKSSYKRMEIIKCIALGMKWVHAVQGSPSYCYTKDILKNSIMNLILVSDILMINREGQFEEVWTEICNQMDNFEEFESTRIDSYPFYCSLNPMLKMLSDLMRSLLILDSAPDFSKILSNFHELSNKYESREIWGLELTNTMLTALNTVMTEVLFRKCKAFSKISENNLKMFINTVAVNESISQLILMSEVNYWIDRIKRKKIELTLNLNDYFSGVWLKTAKENIFISNLEEYFLKVLKDDPEIKQVPSLLGINKIISDGKSFQKLIIDCLKNATNSYYISEPFAPPVSDSKIKIIFMIIERMADHYSLKLASHFSEKVCRIIEKLNLSLLIPNTIIPEMDNKSFIIPLIDNVDYPVFVTYVWRCVNLSNQFLKPMNIQEYLIDLRHELFSQIQMKDADRIISRIMFYVGWRFKFRAIELLSDELFRFHLVFSFLGENLDFKPLIQQNLCFWMRTLPSFDVLKYSNINAEVTPFQIDDFFQCSKMDNVKNHILQVLRGVKNISLQLSDVTFSRCKKGLESTKAILLILRQIFAKLNENNGHKNDNVKYWLKNIKAVETELSIVCCKLDADFNQVLGELNYLLGLIRSSVCVELDAKKKEHRRTKNGLEDNHINLNGSISLKMEHTLNNEIQPKRRKRNSCKEDMSESLTKLAKYNRILDYDNNFGDDKDALIKWASRIQERSTLQSKVNFIDNSSDIALGDMIESRISYVNDPSAKSICIDAGKGKSRPPRYVEIESNPYRNPINIVNKPNLCTKRNSSKTSKHNEFTSLFNFKLLRQVGQGSFGKVFEAVDKFSDIRVALKRITLNNSEEGLPQSILREIMLYKCNNHPNIIQFKGIVVNEIEAIKSKYSDFETIVPKSFYFVFEYMEHDLHGLLKSKSMVFSSGQIGFFAKQLFSALFYLHDRNIIHRDVIPSNLLISNRGTLKLSDFGNARYLTKDVNLDNNIVMTPKIVTYIYRAPEILLDYDTYGPEVDIWSAGCVIYEILTGDKLFNTKKPLNEGFVTMYDFLENISKVVGSPNQSVWPLVNQSKHFVSLSTKGIMVNYSRKIDEFMKSIPFDAADVLKQIFQWDPKKRITAKGVLNSNWIQSVEVETMLIAEFPDNNCHEYLIDNCNKENNFMEYEDKGLEVLLESETNEYHSLIIPNDTNNKDKLDDQINGDMRLYQRNEEESLQDEDIQLFVESLSGKILELSDILDRFRNESAYTAEICKGIIMRAAREWSGRENMRTKMVPFMLEYLLRNEEKAKLCC